MAYSLAYFKFKKSLEKEIRNYWSVSIASEHSRDWLKQFDQSKKLTQIAVNAPPFSYVDIKCSEYLMHLTTVTDYSRENSVVNFITAFEVYLFEILSRIIYLKPNSLKDSEMKFDAKDIAHGMTEGDFKKWFSNMVTDKAIRNKQHNEIIKMIAKFSKCDLKPLAAEIEEWNQWTYVRNAIVHNGRKVSLDLNRVWLSRFSSVGTGLRVTNGELMKIQTLAMTIAKHLDKKVNDAVIEFQDCGLLSRELFIRYGIEDINHIARILQKNLSYKAKRLQIEKELAYQRRTNSVITEMNLDEIINEIELEN